MGSRIRRPRRRKHGPSRWHRRRSPRTQHDAGASALAPADREDERLCLVRTHPADNTCQGRNATVQSTEPCQERVSRVGANSGVTRCGGASNEQSDRACAISTLESLEREGQECTRSLGPMWAPEPNHRSDWGRRRPMEPRLRSSCWGPWGSLGARGLAGAHGDVVTNRSSATY